MFKVTDKVDYVMDDEMLDWYLDHRLRLKDIAKQINSNIKRVNG